MLSPQAFNKVAEGIRLDRHKSHGVVHGLPGVAYQQHGHYFDGDGHPVADPEAPAPEVPSILGPDGLPVQREVEAEGGISADPITPTGVAVSEQPSAPSISRDDMRLKENKALKLQMEAYGEDWRGVDHARKFLGVK